MSRDVGAAVPPGAWPERFVATPRDREALLVLSHLEGLTPSGLRELAVEKRRAERCLGAIASGRFGTSYMREVAVHTDPSAVRRSLAKCAAHLVAPADTEYPPALLALSDPPAWLFVRGDPQGLLDRAVVAIVGARRCSAYGREMAETIAAGLAARGVVVVSGAALGIDAAAHRGALAAGGVTVAVLGSGVDVAHPSRNERLIEEIARTGAVLSEYPPGVPARPRQFPARNRIVAALASAVLVVEGAQSSGSLITAEFALDIGRDVLAVPGPVTSELSRVPHELIRDGATLVRSADDVVEALGSRPPDGGAVAPRPEAPSSRPDVPFEELQLLERLSSAATLEGIATAAGVRPERALSLLSSLELRGLVRSVGGRYERAATSEPV